MVLRFCHSYVGSPASAADLTQEVFLTLWRDRQSYRHDGKLRAYLFTVARYRCLAFKKKHARLEPLERDERVASASAEQGVLAAELRAGLSRLEPEFAEVVALRYLAELELQEIADVTRVPLGTVKSRLHRALGELRRLFDEP